MGDGGVDLAITHHERTAQRRSAIRLVAGFTEAKSTTVKDGCRVFAHRHGNIVELKVAAYEPRFNEGLLDGKDRQLRRQVAEADEVRARREACPLGARA